jgi:hypothetical protein
VIQGISLGPPPVPGMNLGPPPVPGISLGPPPAPGMSLGPPPAPGMSLGPPPAPGMSLGPPPAPGMSLGPPTSGMSLGPVVSPSGSSYIFVTYFSKTKVSGMPLGGPGISLGPGTLFSSSSVLLIKSNARNLKCTRLYVGAPPPPGGGPPPPPGAGPPPPPGAGPPPPPGAGPPGPPPPGSIFGRLYIKRIIAKIIFMSLDMECLLFLGGAGAFVAPIDEVEFLRLHCIDADECHF